MPVKECECGVLFYSSKDGRCPECVYYEFDITPNRTERNKMKRSLSSSKEDLIQSVLRTLGRPVMLEKLTTIIHFACKFLEARHVMPPFHFGISRANQKVMIIAASANIKNVDIDSTQSRTANATVSIHGMGRSGVKEDDIDRDMDQLVRVLGGHSASDITDLLHRHFPQTVLEGRIGRADDDIRPLFPPSNGGGMP